MPTLLASASPTAIATGLPIEAAPELTDEGKAEVAELQRRVAGVEAQEAGSNVQRALLLRAQNQCIAKHGVLTLAHHAENVGFKYKPTTLAHSLPLQLLLNKNIDKASGAERTQMQNEVAQTARASAELERRQNEHAHLTDEQFVDWYKENGNITGLAKSYLKSQKSKKAASSNQSDQAETPEQIVDGMLENTAATDVPSLPGINYGQQGVLLYRNDGETTRLLRLDLSMDAIAALAGFAPCPMTAWPMDLRFWREILIAGEWFVPDETSNVPTVDVPEGDVANSSYPMLPSNGIYLVAHEQISVAHARRDDGLIVQIVPREEIALGFPLTGDCFIDNLTRHRVLKELRGQSDADQFAKNASDGVAAPVTIKGKVTTLAFTTKGQKKPVNLIVKPRDIGSIWTYRVKESFAPVAKAIMSAEQTDDFKARFMPLASKKQKDRQVKIAIAKGEMRLAVDKAAHVPIAAATEGATKAEVMLSDFQRALVGLFDLPLVTGLTWHLDPNGLLMVEASTEVATYRVFMQTLEDNRGQLTPSRALRERVESLPKPDAKAA